MVGGGGRSRSQLTLEGDANGVTELTFAIRFYLPDARDRVVVKTRIKLCLGEGWLPEIAKILKVHNGH